jgi:hypothetical protein
MQGNLRRGQGKQAENKVCNGGKAANRMRAAWFGLRASRKKTPGGC